MIKRRVNCNQCGRFMKQIGGVVDQGYQATYWECGCGHETTLEQLIVHKLGCPECGSQAIEWCGAVDDLIDGSGDKFACRTCSNWWTEYDGSAADPDHPAHDEMVSYVFGGGGEGGSYSVACPYCGSVTMIRYLGVDDDGDGGLVDDWHCENCDQDYQTTDIYFPEPDEYDTPILPMEPISTVSTEDILTALLMAATEYEQAAGSFTSSGTTINSAALRVAELAVALLHALPAQPGGGGGGGGGKYARQIKAVRRVMTIRELEDQVCRELQALIEQGYVEPIVWGENPEEVQYPITLAGQAYLRFSE
ncbi:MAG: hypothetical protein SF162_07565 [bacterium]|nr:hypothetical protein [bacterium]